MSATGTISSPAKTSASKNSALRANHARVLQIWLLCIAGLVTAMILVGGATRLTDSGLSITEWAPLMGAIPPLSMADWQEAFEAYKQIPEYTHVNRGMDLEGFKTIYWWEWAHRFLGRFVGLVFLIPFMVFWLAGYIPRALFAPLIGLFVLGGLQGALGWYMVKSGLVERIDVSQYRLAAHFGVAVLILGTTVWLILGLSRKEESGASASKPIKGAALAAGLVLALIYLQLLAGALVAGIDGGMGFNTWPMMNGALIPNGLGAASPWYLNFFENPLTVQFDHRMLGYAVIAATLAQAVWIARKKDAGPLVGTAVLLAILAFLQAALGIWTLLLAVPIELGLAHQAGAIVLFLVSVIHFWKSLHGSSPKVAQSEAIA